MYKMPQGGRGYTLWLTNRCVDSLGIIPWIDDFNAKPDEVSDVACDNGQAVFEGGCRNHTVGCIERSSSQLALAIQDAPSVCDRLCDGQDAAAESGQQTAVEPECEFCASLAYGEDDGTSPQFADRYHAQVERLLVLCINPAFDIRVGTGANQFGWSVGVEQKTTQERSTGRAMDGFRPTSRSSPRPRAASNNSARFPWGGAATGSGAGEVWRAYKITSSASLNAPLRRRTLMSASTSGLVIWMVTAQLPHDQS
jgi:hypothetical protein